MSRCRDMYGIEKPNKSNVKGEEAFHAPFAGEHTLMKMITRKQAKHIIDNYGSDMMTAGEIVEMIKEHYPEAIFDKLDYTYYVDVENRRFILRIHFSVILDHNLRTSVLMKQSIYDFNNRVKQEYDSVAGKISHATIYGVSMMLELSKRFPIKVVGNCKGKNLLERIFSV